MTTQRAIANTDLTIDGRAQPSELWTAAQAAAADRHTMGALGVPSPVLMERAALSVARELEALHRGEPIVVLAGPGNNGGDGLAIARLLQHRGIAVEVYLVTGGGNASVAAQRAQAHAYGVVVHEGVPDEVPQRATLVVDALLGTGSRGAPRDAIAAAVQWARGVPGPKLAVDLPTGVEGDSGRVPGDCLTATRTVTFVRSKPGLHVTPGRDHAGEVVVADIGIRPDPNAIAASLRSLIDPAWVAERLARRPSAQHKGQRGHVGIVAGGEATPGAALLTATGALRAGAGLITAATRHANVRSAFVHRLPEAMLDDLAGESRLPRATALAIGPGLTDADERDVVPRLWTDDERPAVWDASALACLPAQGPAAGPRIVTPHPGEAAGLLARLRPGTTPSAGDVQRDRIGVAQALAAGLGAVVVLKGAGTIVADPDGAIAIAVAGASELATGGSGDVLTGLAATMLARGESAWDAARMAVHVHAVAGAMAAAVDPVPSATVIASWLGRAQAPEQVQRAGTHWPRWIRG